MVRRPFAAVRGDDWFPPVPLALALAMGGFFLWRLDFAGLGRHSVDTLSRGRFDLAESLLHPLRWVAAC